MEFSDSTVGGFNYGKLYWCTPSYSYNGPASGTNLGIGGTGLSTGNPYTSSWIAQVQATNLMTGVTTGNTYAGLEIYSLYDPDGAGGVATSSNAYYGAYVSTDFYYNSRLIIEWGRWNSTAGDFDRTIIAAISIADTEDVTLRFAYDGAAKSLVADYSFNGVDFLTGGTMSLTGAEAGIGAPYNNGLGLNLYGMSYNDGAIAPGMMYFDNLSVSAVPEPSTYAALAGLSVLGLAIWRRSRFRR